MPGLLDSCQNLFGSPCLYEVLGVDKKSSQSEIKRGYHRLSLKVHPDRVTGDKDTATEKFQTLGKVYSILSDKGKRALYDESGEVDDENDVSPDRDWYDYWRLLFAKISVKDIEEFENKYKGSAEEIDDVKSAYVESEGDMEVIIDSVMCATCDDEDRFREILNTRIDKGELPVFKGFTKDQKKKKKERKKRANEEAQEAEEARKELGIDGEDSLKAMILQRGENRAKETDNFFSHLEQKYAKPSKKGKKGK